MEGENDDVGERERIAGERSSSRPCRELNPVHLWKSWPLTRAQKVHQ